MGDPGGAMQPSFSFTQLFPLNSVSVSGITWLSGSSSFDYQPLLAQAPGQQFLLLGALLVIWDQNSLVPFHTWLPDARRSLDGFSSGWGVAEVGVLWFGLGLFPEAWAGSNACKLGSAGALWRSLKDMKKNGHMGYVLLLPPPLSVFPNDQPWTDLSLFLLGASFCKDG